MAPEFTADDKNKLDNDGFYAVKLLLIKLTPQLLYLVQLFFFDHDILDLMFVH